MKIGNRLSFNQLSIQQRLTLLICSLLMSTIIIYGLANYYSLKKTILIVGKERLGSLTVQVASMLSSNAMPMTRAANKTAADSGFIRCLSSGGKSFRRETED